MESYKEIFTKFKSKFESNKKLFIIALIIISLPLILLIITKFLPSNINLRHINKLSKEILAINSAFDDCITEDSIDPEKSKNATSQSINSLKEIRTKLNDLEVSENNTHFKNILNEALTNNISLCEKAFSLYNNASNTELSTKLKDYNINLDSLKELNKDLNNIGIESILSEKNLEFFDKTNKYFETLIQVNIIKDINSEKNSAYVLAVDKIILNFKEIDEDLKPALNDIVNNNRDINVLTSDISNKKSSFEHIKNDFYSLSIPEEATELHSSLVKTISLYEDYINSIDSSLSDYDATTKDTSIFKDSFSKYSDFATYFKDLCDKLDNFKRK
ncbi:hypothetical protein U729_1404 [Clostridium baratii str. Sullivan]|uniref:Uncharacterized protein n=1 Tax=Clostridium baratii str. Sullivan TaxID=1415775 RepID=A0A0A7FS05_9CLOT|nr:hypothetical protein [Clostridium baratii]AIY82424.1 hypothetical protein U729_1404 [Clostridium baratii str. Sullivan]